MATLAEIRTNILIKLKQEIGTSDWWSEDEIEQWTNDLYIDTSRDGRLLKKRDILTLSIKDQATYSLPTGTIILISMTYDQEPIYPTTIEELNAYSRSWRSEGPGIPCWFYYERGNRYTEVSLHQTPSTSGLEIGFDVIYKPNKLEISESPEEPFTDGLLLKDGVVSMALAKEGGGQNLDRSDYYWRQFYTKLTALLKEPKISGRTHVMRSIEDLGIRGIDQGPRLPLDYPSYPW